MVWFARCNTTPSVDATARLTVTPVRRRASVLPIIPKVNAVKKINYLIVHSRTKSVHIRTLFCFYGVVIGCYLIGYVAGIALEEQITTFIQPFIHFKYSKENRTEKCRDNGTFLHFLSTTLSSLSNV